MALRTLDDLGDVAGTRVFVRVDLNVPLRDGVVADDSKIRGTLPTLRELLDRGARLVLASHFGRPKGQVREDLRLAPVGAALASHLGKPCTSLSEVTPASLPDDDVVLLENLRFDPGEEANDVSFAGRLAELADAYVDDAFGAVHRAHASVRALPDLMHASGRAAVAGRLVQKEVSVLGRLLESADAPYVAILGGAKVSDKLAVIGSLAERVDALVIGGAMAFTLLIAEGAQVGDSLVEPDQVDRVRVALATARERGVTVHLPTDIVAAAVAEAEASTQVVRADAIPHPAGKRAGITHRQAIAQSARRVRCGLEKMGRQSWYGFLFQAFCDQNSSTGIADGCIRVFQHGASDLDPASSREGSGKTLQISFSPCLMQSPVFSQIGIQITTCVPLQRSRCLCPSNSLQSLSEFTRGGPT